MFRLFRMKLIVKVICSHVLGALAPPSGLIVNIYLIYFIAHKMSFSLVKSILFTENELRAGVMTVKMNSMLGC